MQALPGFRDLLPHECAVRNYIFARWREVSQRYGFVEYDGPLLEDLDQKLSELFGADRPVRNLVAGLEVERSGLAAPLSPAQVGDG